MSYSEEHGITVDSIQDTLDCSEEIADRILSICEAGYSHGLDGLYLDSDPSNDDNWEYKFSRDIKDIEEELELDNDEVMTYYTEALKAGHIDCDESTLSLEDNDEDDLEGYGLYD